jgi:hypothetical protein
VDEQILEWVRSVLPGVDVGLSLPGSKPAISGVSVYLLDAASNAVPRGTLRPPLSITLRYLITTWAAEPEEEHRLFLDLLFAALDKPEKEPPEFEVVAHPLPSELWTALDVVPRPSFFLQVPLKREREQKIAPPVRTAVVASSPIRDVRGMVCGPRDTPIMGARVEIPILGVSTQTDSSGRFRFATGGSLPIRIKVRAKGKEAEYVLAPAAANEDGPVIIRLPGLEE